MTPPQPIEISKEAREAANEENRRVWIGSPQPDKPQGHFVQLAIASATEKLTKENESLKNQIIVLEVGKYGVYFYVEENKKLAAEIEARKKLWSEANEEYKKLTAENERLREFVLRVSKQKPEKPDYWNSCGQCEHNIDDAKELLPTIPNQGEQKR